MLTKSFAAAVLAFAASVSAQTFTDCDPLEKTCPADPAFGKNSVDCDLTASGCPAFETLPGTTVDRTPEGWLFSIKKESNAPTMATHKRIFFGSLEVEMKAAPGKGIISSIVLESADLDEIDWEWVGGDDTQVQSNYYGKGDTTTYDRVGYHGVSDPFNSFHTYKIDWTAESIKWIIDGEVVRTLKYSEAQGGDRFPQTPMEVKIGTWVGGRKNAPTGTVEWAGGYAEWDKAPFDALYKSIKIVDYAGKSSPATEDIKEYVWSNKSGSWQSIKVVKGDGSSDDSKDEETTTSKPKPKPTTTEEADEETTTSKPKPKPTTTSSEEETTTSSPSSTPASGTSESSTISTVASSTAEETPGTSTTSGEGASQTPEDAATGILASFGRVAAAGAAAVLVAQLF